MLYFFTKDVKRHNSFTSPNIKRAPVAKRVGRERCHSYHAPTPKTSKNVQNPGNGPRVSAVIFLIEF